MNFDFSEEQKLIQAEARKFLKHQCPSSLSRALMEDPAAYPHQLWQQVVDLGWTGLTISQEFGGLGLGDLELCVLAQELGRALAPLPFSSTVYLFSEALKLAGSPSQQARVFPNIVDGSLQGCLAISEQAGDHLESIPETVFVNGKLSGTKLAVSDGQFAKMAVVSARDDNSEMGLYLVSLNQASIECAPTYSLDPSRPQATLKFSAADADTLCVGKQAKDVLSKVFNRAAVLFAFEQVGGCEAALKMGMAYTKQRFAFGRPVASFQAIKHKFADMYVAKEIALANAYYGAWALHANAEELPLAAATARVSAIDAYFECSKENLQAHGGMGYTWELDCHLHYRRAQHLSLVLGGTPVWKERISQQLLASN